MRKNILFLVIYFGLSNQVVAQDDRDTELLAASCAACHGTRGHSVADIPVLAGMDKNTFKQKIAEFISGERKATVMHQHSLGYTTDEIDLLAVFFSQQ